MKLALTGAICGLAWAAGLRSYMAEVAGAASAVTWVGTMAGVLAPGMVVGALLGWAEHLRREGDGSRRRWLALSPVLLAAFPLAMPGALTALLTTGLGGGAVMVPVIGMAGGYALCGRGRSWTRVASGTVALSIVPLWALVAPLTGGSLLALDTPRGMFVALHLYALLAVLSIACSFAFRTVVLPATPAIASQRAQMDHGA